MSEYKIEKGVEMPAARSGPGSKYPFRQMEIGDSIVSSNVGVRNAAAKFSERTAMKFASRKQPDGTYRVWRVA